MPLSTTLRRDAAFCFPVILFTFKLPLTAPQPAWIQPSILVLAIHTIEVLDLHVPFASRPRRVVYSRVIAARHLLRLGAFRVPADCALAMVDSED
jgi:hypothetical protein